MISRTDRMPCGHLQRFLVVKESGSPHCLACEIESLQEALLAVTFYAYQPPDVRKVIDTLKRKNTNESR